MIALRTILGFALTACAVQVARAEPVDCPLAHAPYSVRTPVIDLLLDPRAKAVLDREFGPALAKLPPGFASTTPPTFAAIISVKEVMGMIGAPNVAATLARLDPELRAIPITPAASRARCARYDHVPPKLPATLKHPALLVFDKITGFRDTPSVDAATAALKAMAQRRGWTLVFTDKGAVFNQRDLARFDAVIWNNVSGDALTVPQQKAFQAYLAKGGGFAGFHGASGDPFYVWDWYPDTLIGARFIGHPGKPQFQQARVVVDDTKSAITRGLGDGWTMTEEWYSFAKSPRGPGTHVLATLDEKSYAPIGYHGETLAMGDHPIAWTRCIGAGRSFYSAIGHRPENYTEPNSVRLLEQGIAGSAGLGETTCQDGRETAR